MPQRIEVFVGDGVITSAFVDAVSPDQIRLLIHPQLPVTVLAEPTEDVSLLATPGDVVTVEVVPLDGQLLAGFSDETPVPAISVLPGGPPWVLPASPPSQSQPSRLRSAEEAERSESSPSQTGALEEEVARLEQELADAATTITELRRSMRRSRHLTSPRVYRDPERQLRFELDLAYLLQVEESDRERYPWPSRYLVGPDFLQSVDRLVAAGGITRDKIIQVCVDVLSGRVWDRPVRAAKEWLTAEHGSQMERPRDGAVAMRVRLQNVSHGARRLRYWCLPTGLIELDMVGNHDEKLRTGN